MITKRAYVADGPNENLWHDDEDIQTLFHNFLPFQTIFNSFDVAHSFTVEHTKEKTFYVTFLGGKK